ncbi:MAG: helix-turn-helix domain-containing protein [Alphaproteobacteria bacterium]|nr:helix-turn-helix domain-containing protein [Alphaproteobacteria bacterium]
MALTEAEPSVEPGAKISQDRKAAVISRAKSRTIGWLARRTNTKVQTVRYYEQIGLMPEPPRSEGNRRLYEEAHADRLAFIRHSRDFGFSLDAIRELLGLVDHPDQSCVVADRVARSQLVEVNLRISRLEALRTELERMAEQCSGGNVAQCRVIEVLADHSKCLTGNHGAA